MFIKERLSYQGIHDHAPRAWHEERPLKGMLGVMLTSLLPFVIYLLSFPVMLITVLRVEVGILFFISCVPIVALVKKIAEFPYGHNFADFLLVSMMLGWIFKGIKKQSKILKKNPLNAVVILLVVGSIISLIRGYIIGAFSPEINLARLVSWKNYMILPCLYLVTANSIENPRFIKWVIVCLSFSMLAMDFNFYSTFQWYSPEHYTDQARISGTFKSLGPNEMAIFYSMYTCLLLGISYFMREKKLKYLLLAVCVCNLYPILYSYSRSGYMCILVGILFFGILRDRRLLVVLIAVIALYRALLPVSVVDRIDQTFLDNEQIIDADLAEGNALDVGGVTLDTVGRKELWDKAKAYFSSNPLLGIGFDTFRFREGMITHSLYLRILSEDGVLGFFIFVVFTATLLKKSYQLFKHSESDFFRGIGLGLFVSEIVNLTGGAAGDISIYYHLMAIRWLFIGVVASYYGGYIQSQDFVT